MRGTRERTYIFPPLRKPLDYESSPSTYAPTGGFVQTTQLGSTLKTLVHGSDGGWGARSGVPKEEETSKKALSKSPAKDALSK